MKNPSQPRFYYYGDAIVHKGKVFAVDGINGNIYAWDLRAGACPEPELVRPPRVNHDDFKYLWNLAESADGRRLLLACTYGQDVRGYKYCYKQERETVRYEGDGVRLYELDVDAAGSDGDGWSRVTSLGDRALFLGANYPFFASVNRESSDEQLLRPNCVCFAVTKLFEYPSEDYDVVVFDLDDQKHRQVTWCYSSRYHTFQTPIWFRPTLGKSEVSPIKLMPS